MQIYKAKVLDPKHLELSEPVKAASGESIRVFISEPEDALWADAARKNFLNAYAPEDAVYDAGHIR